MKNVMVRMKCRVCNWLVTATSYERAEKNMTLHHYAHADMRK